MPFSRADAEMEMRIRFFGRARLGGANWLHARSATARRSLALPTAASASHAFTLIELLVVIVIIAVLMGISFPVFQSIQNQAKKTQAKNDVTQIVTAVNAFYTEYGKYPLPSTASGDTKLPGDALQQDLMDALRNNGGTLNPRAIVFLSPPDAKNPSQPRSGIANRGFYDPWGNLYFIAVDGDYDNIIAAAKHGYTDLNEVRSGVIAWSYGLDGSQGRKASGDNKYSGSDDVISWQ